VEKYPKIRPKRVGRKGLSCKEITRSLKSVGVEVRKTCPECGGELEESDELIFEATLSGERVVIPNLSGTRCTKCGLMGFDPKSSRIIEQHTAGRPSVGFERTVTNVGNRAAIYLPADIVRDMKVEAGMKVKFYPRTDKSIVLEFEK
jgi:YgiT-type zinc finger domain-containing protein